MTQKKNIQAPVFLTERLYLRGVTATDIPVYEKDFVNYDVIQTLSAAVPWPYPEGGVSDYVLEHLLPAQGNNHWAWSICLKANPNRQIGNITLWRPGTPENRGFWLAKEHSGAKLLRIEPGDYVDPSLTEQEVWKLTANEWKAHKAGSG